MCHINMSRKFHFPIIIFHIKLYGHLIVLDISNTLVI